MAQFNPLHDETKATQTLKPTASPTPAKPLPAQPAVQLQRVVGNQRLNRVVGDATSSRSDAARISLQRLINQRGDRTSTVVQTKLTLGPVGDQYEQEADAVAKQVVDQLSTAPQQAAAQGDAAVQRQDGLEEEELQMKAQRTQLQRQELPEEELMAKRQPEILQRQELPEEEEELMAKRVQRSATAEGGAVSDDIETAIQRARGGGQTLNTSVRAPMEQAFGADFSGVNIHTGAEADHLNQSLQARAFTTGQDIFFRQGEFNPGGSEGKELLAHELTHVVQQNGAAVQREGQ